MILFIQNFLAMFFLLSCIVLTIAGTVALVIYGHPWAAGVAIIALLSTAWAISEME